MQYHLFGTAIVYKFGLIFWKMLDSRSLLICWRMLRKQRKALLASCHCHTWWITMDLNVLKCLFYHFTANIRNLTHLLTSICGLFLLVPYFFSPLDEMDSAELAFSFSETFSPALSINASCVIFTAQKIIEIV